MGEPRIIEIGEVPLVRHAYPGTTEFFSTMPDRPQDLLPGDNHVDLTGLPRLAKRLMAGDVDLIFVQVAPFAPLSLDGLSRTIFRRSTLRGRAPFLRAFGQQMVRLAKDVPIVVWDSGDTPLIGRHNLDLLDRALVYFKRELPPDHWRLFMGGWVPRVPTPRYRSVQRHRDRIAKLRPIALGLPFGTLDHPDAVPVPASEKTADVFFAGQVHASSTLRARGLAELLTLRESGLRLDIPDAPLPRDAFLRRCARAHLVWSPEGLGWDCFRTYEAALCGSVAVQNRPTIERHRPLEDGVHMLHYDAEPGGLSRVVMTALADKARLAQMADAARRHVLEHHTPAAIARHMITHALALAGRGIPADR